MNAQPRFETYTPLRDAEVIRNLISDLERKIIVLECEIATEEQKTRLFDARHPHYSILAREMTTRRNNLLATIASLQDRLRNGSEAALGNARAA